MGVYLHGLPTMGWKRHYYRREWPKQMILLWKHPLGEKATFANDHSFPKDYSTKIQQKAPFITTSLYRAFLISSEKLLEIIMMFASKSRQPADVMPEATVSRTGNAKVCARVAT